MNGCLNYHFGPMSPEDAPDLPCFKKSGCFDDPDHPAWQPKTNGDRVREMTDAELVKLYTKTSWDDKFFPACASDPDNECSHRNITCESCPNTFANWLGAEAEE